MILDWSELASLNMSTQNECTGAYTLSYKHLHPFMHVNRMSPVLFCASCNRSTIEFRRPRVSLCRINFTRPKQHSPAKSYVQGKPCTCSAPNLLFLPLTNKRLCVEPDTVFHRTKAARSNTQCFQADVDKSACFNTRISCRIEAS